MHTIKSKITSAVKYTSLPTSSNTSLSNTSLSKTPSSNISSRANRLFINISSVLILSMVALATPANAASQCKGLNLDECNQNATCGWVEGYERKDGRTVKSFCRTSRAGISVKSKDKSTAKELLSNANTETN